MKKIIAITVFSLISFTSFAQSEWQKPTDNTQTQEPKRGLLDRNKTKTIAPKYLEGGVPEIDGKVTWEKSFDVPGKSADAIYDTMLAYLQQFVKMEGQTDMSQVAIVNKSTKQIVARASEWLVFENRLLSLDQTLFNYIIIADCSNGACKVKITNLNYRYEEGRPTEMSMTAEEWINDKNALNKKKTGFQKGGVKKFRMKTIDRIENIFAGIETALK